MGGVAVLRMLDPRRQCPPLNTKTSDMDNQEDPPRSRGDFPCQTAHNTRQRVPPETNHSEKRHLRQAAPLFHIRQAQATVTSTLVSAEESSHPEVEETEEIIERNWYLGQEERRLSNNPVIPGGRESGPRWIGEVGQLPGISGVTGDVAGKYPVLSGDT